MLDSSFIYRLRFMWKAIFLRRPPSLFWSFFFFLVLIFNNFLRQTCLICFWNAAERNSKGTACCLCEELLYIFPAISLLSSPSKSVKAAAACLLSTVDRLVSDLLNVPRKTVVSNHKFLHINKPKSIPFRLLHHLWLQVSLYELFRPSSFWL